MASNSHSTVENPSRLCSQCGELFREPKLLPCGHLLCCSCLLDWVTNHDQAPCPLCGNPIINPESTQLKSLQEIARDFPTDLSMEALVKSDHLLNQEHNCCVCEDVAATSLCLSCGDLLCRTCKRAHRKLSSLKHHTVEDLAELTPLTIAAHRPVTCLNHPEETPTVFCATHGQSICLQCVISVHRTCPDLEDLQEKMEESQEVMKEFVSTLTSGEAHLQQAMDELEQHLEHTRQNMDSAMADIDTMCDRMQSSVTKNRHRLKQQLTEAYSDVKDAVDDGKESLHHRQIKLSSHKQIAGRVQELKNYDDVHVMRMVMEARAHDLDYSVTLTSDAKPISSFTFAIDQEAVSQIEEVMDKLGQLQVFPTKMIANQLPVFQFHARHGRHVRLSNEGMTAERALHSGSDQAIVLSADQLHCNVLYEVRVDKWEGTYVEGSMCVGVVTSDPLSLQLPAWSGHFKTAAIVIRKNWVKNCVAGSQVRCDYGSALGTLKAGSRVGVALDSARCLHLYVDGRDQGIAARHVPRPCYALFDVCDDVRMVTALPVTRVTTRQPASPSQLLSIPGRESTM